MQKAARRLARTVVAAAVLAAGATALVVGATARPAAAHANLLATVPADKSLVASPPALFTFRFTEAVRPADADSVKVVGTDGQRVDDGLVPGPASELTLKLKPDLPPGAYVGTFSVISEDSHVVRGGATFVVIGGDGAAPGDIDVSALLPTDGGNPALARAATALRMVGYASALLAAGGVLFLVAAVRSPALAGAAATVGSPAAGPVALGASGGGPAAVRRADPARRMGLATRLATPGLTVLALALPVLLVWTTIRSASTADAGSSGTPVIRSIEQFREQLNYDATAPVDLSGMPGVTPEQQEWSEQLVERTLEVVPSRFPDVAAVEAAGYVPADDGVTGFQHYVRFTDIADDVRYDPEHPESIVFRVEPDGSRTLAGVMFMIPYDQPVAVIEKPGGLLMQLHQRSFDLALYVWTIPKECGPFAPLPFTSGGKPLPNAPRCR